MTAEPIVHRKGAFGGAIATMVPVAEAAAAAAAQLAARGDIDAVIPLTHQDMADDVAMSKTGLGFPVILGGYGARFHHEFCCVRVSHIGVRWKFPSTIGMFVRCAFSTEVYTLACH